MAREMKDSGIKWIGDIPNDWEISRIGEIYDQRIVKVSDKDYMPLSVTMKGIVPQLASAAKTDDGDNRKLVKKGDFVINSRSDRRGSCGISDYDGSVSLINIILSPRNDMNPNYYNWLFHSTMFSSEFYKWGHGIVDDLWTTRWQDMKSISIPRPSLNKQQLIASFLDSKCQEIDNVLAKTRSSIEEYKKLKQAIITKAVTKGIKPNVETKDSRIEWIGRVPKQWKVLFLKYVSKFQEGPGIMAEDFRTEGIPLIRISGLKNNFVTLDGCNYLDEKKVLSKWSHFKLCLNDIVISASASMGDVSFVDEQAVGCIPYTGIIRFPQNNRVFYRYLYYFLKSDIYIEQINVQKTGSTIQHYGPSHLNRVKILMPNLNEQKIIADYLDQKCSVIDNLISQKEQLITELESYKKSLIYEYVTGKKEVPTA